MKQNKQDLEKIIKSELEFLGILAKRCVYSLSLGLDSSVPKYEMANATEIGSELILY